MTWRGYQSVLLCGQLAAVIPCSSRGQRHEALTNVTSAYTLQGGPLRGKLSIH